MLAPLRGQKSRSLIEAISRWWSDWIRKRSTLSQLEYYAENEVERTAKDLGISADELRRLASRGPESADLLRRRMAALDLDPNEVAQTESRTFQDLQKVCALCESHRRCARDLGRDSADPVWQDYCPNATTLLALNAQPWAARREW